MWQQLGLGLVIPSLELTRWQSRQPHTSMPVVYTTLKMVVRRRSYSTAGRAAAAAADDDDDDNSVQSDWYKDNHRSREPLSSRSVCIVYSTPLSTLISSHSLDHHLYADDTQIFLSFRPPDFQSSSPTGRLTTYLFLDDC